MKLVGASAPKTQTREELENGYSREDPWGYKTNPADIKRKEIILSTLSELGPFAYALDIACGEGWITGDLPAYRKYGYEISDQAAARFPPNVKRLFGTPGEFGVSNYDLVIITGALYREYDWLHFVDMINHYATKIILTCNIKDREVPEAIAAIEAKQIFEREFEYARQEGLFTQKLRVFQK